MIHMIEYVREQTRQNIELIHDVHERLYPIDAVRFAKDVEPYKLFFLKDVLAPEDIGRITGPEISQFSQGLLVCELPGMVQVLHLRLGM